MPEPERIDRRRAALVAYDVCRRALVPSDPARRAAMRPVLDAWVQMIAAARGAGVPVIYTTPVSRSDGADVVMLPTDLSAETGVPPLTNAIEGTAEAGFPDEIAPRPDYVFLKRRPSAFYGTGVAELLHMLRRDTIIIGGGATNLARSKSEDLVISSRPSIIKPIGHLPSVNLAGARRAHDLMRDIIGILAFFIGTDAHFGLPPVCAPKDCDREGKGRCAERHMASISSGERSGAKVNNCDRAEKPLYARDGEDDFSRSARRACTAVCYRMTW